MAFSEKTPTAYPVFFRTYSRHTNDGRETWEQVCQRTVKGLKELGNLTQEEAELIYRMQSNLKTLSSGRWLWVGGTEWIEKPENFFGAYNCSATNIVDWRAFGLLMNLAMTGCGTGAVIEPRYINQLPTICNRINVTIQGQIGQIAPTERKDETEIKITSNDVLITVGDSRQGWVKSYQALLELSSDDCFDTTEPINVTVDISNVRKAGERLKGFGGVANPIKLAGLYNRCANILNKAIGRQLNSVECCLLIDEAAVVVVAGNVRRSAGIRQGSSHDALFTEAKMNLWQQDEEGNWRIDPERDALRMANHSRVFHHKPTLEETIEAVSKQYNSGEGAIQWAGEAVARSNVDLLPTEELKEDFLNAYHCGTAKQWLTNNYPTIPENEINHRLERYGLNPCVTGDTWILTEKGAVQAKDLVGKQISLYVNGELFSTTSDGFWLTGCKQVLELQTKEGYCIKLTSNHQLLKAVAQTQRTQYTEWVEAQHLKEGDRIILHNHREIEAWDGKGTESEGWLLGNFVGDGCFSVNEKHHQRQAALRYWGHEQAKMANIALQLSEESLLVKKEHKITMHSQNEYLEIKSAKLYQLALDFGLKQHGKTITNEIESGSHNFCCGFLRGLFDADGSVQESQEKGISVRLSQSNLGLLQAVQRMLARIGVISAIYENRRIAGERMLPNSARELQKYTCNSQHELVIANDNLNVFSEKIGFLTPSKQEKLANLLGEYKRKPNRERFTAIISSIKIGEIEPVFDCTVPGPAQFDANGIVSHNCGEIIGANFMCNLAEVHLNKIDPTNLTEIKDAFKAAALNVGALLNHKFIEPRYKSSRELDPIVGVSFTGLFDFFVNVFGTDWLRWWEAGRPSIFPLTDLHGNTWDALELFDTSISSMAASGELISLDAYSERYSTDNPKAWNAGLLFKDIEAAYLQWWKKIVHQEVWAYCDRHGLKRPNRCTTVQPAGSKSLLTGASPGWHPPKAQRFIRRITFAKNDPVALACIDYGYSVTPSQSDKDEDGVLLNDPFDPRCTEWLVEIPVSVPWADLPGADRIDISKFSAVAQFDFYMNVQSNYTSHNTSATIELRSHEIEELGTRIYEAIENNEGYISSALLARFDDLQTYPRLPFEPINKETYDRLVQEMLARRVTDDFHAALAKYDNGEMSEGGPAGCDSDKCMFPATK